MKERLLVLALATAVCIGCISDTTPSAKSPTVDENVDTVKVKVPAVNKGRHRTLSAKQETLLRTFAMKESPQLWQTVQAWRAEIDNRSKAMARLAADLREFDRKPEDDPTHRDLQIGQEQIACVLDNVYEKLEDAYISYKKFQATPGKKEYADAMKRALEEGILEAESTARRFRIMAIEK